MNPILLSIADGTAFFVGLGLVFLAEALLLLIRRSLLRSLLIVLIACGVLLVAVSGTPLPIWAYALWLIPVLSGVVLLNRAIFSRRLRIGCFSAILLTTLALAAKELPYHRAPSFPVPDGATVYVLGDSISAGMGTRHIPWPEVLDDMTSHRIVNLALAGATVESALLQAEGIADAESYVILEIGGNDMLGDTAAAEFRSTLDTLVSRLDAQGHHVLLFELPLVPFKNAFGEAQREVAAKYNVVLLPKRYFTKVLGTKDATLDGLHLSQIGHDAMATTVAKILNQR